MSSEMMRFLIAWVPSIIFIVVILVGLLVGLIRGFRKSLILTIQAGVAGLICFITYLCIINNKRLDEWGFKLINSGMSIAGTNLQTVFNVSQDCDSIKSVLIEFIPKSMNYGDGLQLVLLDNGAYLATIVDVCYHLIFALIFFIFYFILVFIFYIIYLLFYPERRYKRKKNQKYREALIEHGYKKHPLLGALVGGLRSAVVGLVGLSFLGALFFILAGGVGDKEYKDYPEYSFDNEMMDTTYDVYKAIGSYGTTGIFKVLNVVRDSKDLPFYLCAANLVLSGGLTDTNREINENIFLTKELGVYTNFSRKTFDLVLKYDTDGEIKKIIQNSTDDNMLDVITKIMAKEGFQEEFNQIIEDFEGSTYFVNLSLSLIDSIATHLEDLNFTENMDENTKAILKILFTGEHKITASSLLSKEDTKVLVNACIDMLVLQGQQESLDDTQKTLLYGKTLLPEITKLSILNDEPKKKMLNPVLRELYDYFAQSFLDGEEQEPVSTRAMALTSVTIDDVDWISELKMLLNATTDALNLYDSIYKPNLEIVDALFGLFPEDNEELARQNEKLYDNVMNTLGDSKLFGVVLSSSYVRNMMDDVVTQIAPTAALPKQIDYVNQYDSNGELVKKGEIYNLLNIIKVLIRNNSKDLLEIMQNSENMSKEDMKSLSGILGQTVETENKTVLSLALDSDIMHYAISGIILDFVIEGGIQDFKIIIPNECKEVGKDQITLLKKDALSSLMDNVVSIFEIMIDDKIDYKQLLIDMDSLLATDMIHATMIYNLSRIIQRQEAISVPEEYLTAALEENLLEFGNNIWKTSNETNHLLTAMDELLNIKNSEEFNMETAVAEIKNKVLELNHASSQSSEMTKLDVCYQSVIIRSTLAKQLDNALNTYLQEEVRESAKQDGYYKKSEIKVLIDALDEMDIVSLENLDAAQLTNQIFNMNEPSKTDPQQTKLDILYSSILIKNSFTKSIDDVLNENVVSTEVRDSELVKETQSDLNIKCYKEEEISAVINALKVLDITTFDTNSFDTNVIENKVLGLNEASFIGGKSKLDVLYDSVIIKNALTKPLDTAFSNPSLQVHTEVLEMVKETQSGVSEKVYDKEEVSKIIDALSEKGLGISNLNALESFDYVQSIQQLNQIPEGQNETKLNVIYKSDIIKDILSVQIDNTLNDNSAVVNDPEAKCNLAGTNIMVYAKEELEVLIHFLNSFTDSSLNNLDMSSLTMTTETKEYVLTSKILYATASKHIIENEEIKVPTDLIQSSGDIRKINNETEMASLLDAVIELSGGSLSGEIDLTLNEHVIALICDSTILRATISDKLVNNENMIIPVETIDTTILDLTMKVIIQAELNHLLTAIHTGLGITDVNSFDSVALQIPKGAEKEVKENALVASSIMRATITKNVKSSDNSVSIYVENDLSYVAESIDINQNKILILSEAEIKALINTIDNINQGDTFEISISYPNLLLLITDIEKSYEVLKSNIGRIIIGNFIVENQLYGISYGSAFNSYQLSLNTSVQNGVIEIAGHDSYALIKTGEEYFFASPSEINTYNLETVVQEMNTHVLTSDDIVAYLLFLKGYVAMMG